MIILRNLNIPYSIWLAEWYHGLDTDQFQGQWCEFTKHFSRYFSTQGRNIKHLHERWHGPSHLIQPQMTLKNTSEMLERLLSN